MLVAALREGTGEAVAMLADGAGPEAEPSRVVLHHARAARAIAPTAAATHHHRVACATGTSIGT